jgi:hypothetical protein
VDSWDDDPSFPLSVSFGAEGELGPLSVSGSVSVDVEGNVEGEIGLGYGVASLSVSVSSDGSVSIGFAAGASFGLGAQVSFTVSGELFKGDADIGGFLEALGMMATDVYDDVFSKLGTVIEYFQDLFGT